MCPFIEVLCLFRAFVLFLATLHLQQTLFLFTHFYISLCEVLLILIPCLLHDYTYIILFLYLFLFMNFSFLIVSIILSVAIEVTRSLKIYVSLYFFRTKQCHFQCYFHLKKEINLC